MLGAHRSTAIGLLQSSTFRTSSLINDISLYECVYIYIYTHAHVCVCVYLFVYIYCLILAHSPKALAGKQTQKTALKARMVKITSTLQGPRSTKSPLKRNLSHVATHAFPHGFPQCVRLSGVSGLRFLGFESAALCVRLQAMFERWSMFICHGSGQKISRVFRSSDFATIMRRWGITVGTSKMAMTDC